MQNRLVLKLFGFLAPILTWIINALIPGRKASVLATECRNKSKIMGLVQSLGGYVDPEGKTPLETIVEKCYALGSFPALWAVEGAGKDIAEWRMARDPNPTRLLIDAPLGAQWDKAQLMLHAGIGLGFAKHYIERLGPQPPGDAVRQAVTRTVDLCRNNSRPGYYGAAIESLGLVSRFLKDAAFCRRVHEILSEYAPDSVGYFWRGAGRCLYFHPTNFIPGFKRPSRAFDRAEAEAPTPELKYALHSGMAWALTVVNMTNPEVMAWVLENDADYFAGSPGFVNGVMSSVTMRYDTTPDDPLITRFMNYRPAKPEVRELWQSRIATPIETVIKRIHPVLKQHQRLDEVFHYQPLLDLVARLEREAAAAAASKR